MPRTRAVFHIAPTSTDAAASAAPMFALHPEVWYAISAYVYTGAMLPATMGGTDVKERFALVRAHTTEWRDHTFKQLLEVADNVVRYGYRAPALCESLLDSSNDMLEAADGSADFDAAKRDMLMALTRLIDGAKAHAEHAVRIKGLVEAFKTTTEADHAAIKTLKTTYDAQYGKDSDAEKADRNEIEDLQREIASLNEEYSHQVVVAATTPTYLLVWPLGLIPAAIVAGIYGDRAVKTKRKIEETQRKLL